MLEIYGLQKFSLVEWPGKMAAIIFTGGCNFRCHFCHNPGLVTELDKTPIYPWEEVTKFLDKKVGWIDAIMITGGEPTIHPELPKFLEMIKEKGYLVGLATNGTNPKMLKELVEKKIIDKINMDVKSTPSKYSLATNSREENLENVKKSIDFLLKNKVDYEFKITVVPEIVNKEDIPQIGNLIKGAKKVTLQQFRPLKTLDKTYESKVPYREEEIKEMAKELGKYVGEVNLDFIG